MKKHTFFFSVITFLSLYAIVPIHAMAQSNNKTFSIVVTPKMINDFTKPGPSVTAFYNNYKSLMSQFAEQLIVFYVGTGDHIYRYPPNAFAANPVTTSGIYEGTPIAFDAPSGNNGATVAQVPNDTPPGVTIPSIQVSINGPTGLQVTAQLPGQGILLRDYPMMKWSWKKNGGATLIIQFLLHSRTTGKSVWLGYYEGALPPGSAVGSWAQLYLGPLATGWETQKVNLWQDASLIIQQNYIGSFAEDWEILGIALTPYDGVSASFDQIEASSDGGICWARSTNTDILGFSQNTQWLNQTKNPITGQLRYYPQELTYSELRGIFQEFKQQGQGLGLNVKIFDGMDADDEFALSEWKYRRHPEVNDLGMFYFDKPMNGDIFAYKTEPNGITQGLISGDFIANQIGAYAADMGLDGMYSTNGYGTQPEVFAWINNCLYNPTLAQTTLAFFKNVKQQLAGRKYLWMDTYLSTQADYECWSLPSEAFQYIDYLELSTFWQNAQGQIEAAGDVLGPSNNPNAVGKLLNTPNKTLAQYATDEITSELPLKSTLPQLRILWTYYFADPWYPPATAGGGGYGAATTVSAINPYVNNLDGMLVYSNDYQGNNLNPSWIAPLGSIFSSQASPPAPTVDACTPAVSPCPGLTAAISAPVTLNGSVSDIGASGSLTTTWSRLSYTGAGVGTVTFGTPTALTTTAQFSDPGTYVLQLSASNGQSQNSDSVTVTVNPSGTGFVTAITSLGTSRNNISAWVGMQVRVGAAPLVVSSLGRIVAPGNSQPHQVKFVLATGQDVPRGSVSFTPAGVAGQFSYASLPAPITLAANTLYYLVSQEVSGGDSWYDYDTTLATTADGTIVGPIWSLDSTTWNQGPLPTTVNHAYVPVDFRYQVQLESSLSVAPAVLTFSALARGANPTAQSVTLSNTGPAASNWTVTSDAFWLTTLPVNGSVAAGTNPGPTITVNAPVGSLTPNTYTGHLTFMDQSGNAQMVTVTFNVSPNPSVVCSDLGTSSDPSATLQNCLSATAAGGTLYIPPGNYTVDAQIQMTQPITLTTQGKTPSDPPCNAANSTGCAEIIGGSNFVPGSKPGYFLVTTQASGGTIDHMIFNGDRTHRGGSVAAAACLSGNNGPGINLHIDASNFFFTNNVSENAVCGSGLEYGGTTSVASVVISSNTFAYNGVHNQKMLWSDGLTVGILTNSAITNNFFIDNTDVDLIFGTCQSCSIQNNQIQHSGVFAGGSYAALMIQSWPPTPGNYTGSDVSSNKITCNASCGFGLLIGGDPWYDSDVSGGAYHDNTISGAQQGFTISHAHDLSIYRNTVTPNTGGNFYSGCGLRATTPYNISPASYNIDRSQDNASTVYSSVDWTGCILNWWANPQTYDIGQFVSQSVPSSMVAGQSYTVSITMQNDGNATWTQAAGYALGAQNPQDNATWGLNRATLGSTDSIAPGQSKTFSFTVTAMGASGTQNFQWQMVQDVVGGAWFGDVTPNVAVTVNPAPSGTGFVTAITSLGTPRNNFPGWVGMQVQVGAAPLVVSSLGRIVASGNTQPHAVKFVLASTGQDVPGGSVSFTPAGTPNQFSYASLPTPITLTANTLYYLVSQEVSGGDGWYDYDTTLTSTADGIITGPIFSSDSINWGLPPSPTVNHAYVPVDFRYQVLPTLAADRNTYLVGQAPTYTITAAAPNFPITWNSWGPGGTQVETNASYGEVTQPNGSYTETRSAWNASDSWVWTRNATIAGVTATAYFAVSKNIAPGPAQAPAIGAISGRQGLGIFHWGNDYQTTASAKLVEGAQLALNLGSQNIALALTPRYTSADYPGENFGAGPINTVTDLIKTPAFQQVLQMPFKTYVLVTFTFSDVDYLGTQNLAGEQTEFANLVTYLLQTYKGTGKTFILKNWEGDNAMSLQVANNYTTPPTPQVVNNMVAWLNARHAGLLQGRASAGAVTGVQVEDAAEFNRVTWPRAGQPSMLTSVIPNVLTDYISYSSYETINGPTTPALYAAIQSDLTYIRGISGFKGRPLFAGEYGFSEGYYDDAGNRTQISAQAFLDAGLLWAFNWVIEDSPGARGMNLVRSDGSHSPMWTALHAMEVTANHAPVAQPQSLSLNENTSQAIPLVATDADNDLLTYTITANPSHGSLSGTAPNVTYTPTAGYIGPDSFSFKANDNLADSNIAIVSITVTSTPVPNLVLVKTASASTAQSGDTITFTIHYQNTGGGNTVNAMISDPLPAGTTLVPGSISNGGTINSNVISWTLGSVAAGATGSVNFQVQIN